MGTTRSPTAPSQQLLVEHQLCAHNPPQLLPLTDATSNRPLRAGRLASLLTRPGAGYGHRNLDDDPSGSPSAEAHAGNLPGRARCAPSAARSSMSRRSDPSTEMRACRTLDPARDPALPRESQLLRINMTMTTTTRINTIAPPPMNMAFSFL